WWNQCNADICRGQLGRRVLRFLAVLIVLALIVSGAYVCENVNFAKAGPAAAHGAETDVIIKPGVGLKGIAQELQVAGVIENPLLFEVGVRLRSEERRVGKECR